MTLKYDFAFNTTNNFFADALIMVQENSYDLFTYGIVACFFFVLYYVFVNANNDKELSFNLAFFASIVLSIVWYYMGVFLDNTYGIDSGLFSGVFLITEVVVFVLTFGIMRFNRNNLNE